ALIGKFGFASGRAVDKFEGVSHRLSEEGVPFVTEHVLSYLGGRVVGELDARTHTVFAFEVTEAEVLAEGTPMTYAYYHQVKRGTTPPSAPVAASEEDINKERGDHMDRYVCTICGYVYDPELGDSESGVEPGTPFENLPDDWTCPICGAAKDAFEKE
ncbi:MAG: rubredoxin, partial [Bacillota bacterium]